LSLNSVGLFRHRPRHLSGGIVNGCGVIVRRGGLQIAPVGIIAPSRALYPVVFVIVTQIVALSLPVVHAPMPVISLRHIAEGVESVTLAKTLIPN